MQQAEFLKQVKEIITKAREANKNQGIDVEGFKSINNLLKNIKGMGEKKKILQDGEAVFRQYFRKSLMAGQSIKAGTVITEDMVYAMRPQIYAKGLPSERYEEVIGKVVTKDLNKYDPITFDVLK